MTASEIILLRTGKSGEKVNKYIELSEQEVRSYLHLPALEPLDKYVIAVADIAIVMMEKDDFYQNNPNGGVTVKGESFSEGGVSTSKTYLAGSEALSYFNDAIQDILKGLDATAKRVRFI